MRKYIEISKLFFKTQLTYRFDVITAILYTITKILFAYILWGAIFGQNETISGFTFTQMLSYYIISSFLSQIEMSERVSGEINARIRGGTFSKYMFVPVNVNGYFIAQTFGSAAFYIIFVLGSTAIWILIFGMGFFLTSNLFILILTSIMILIGLLFMIQLNFFLGLFAFRYQGIDAFLMIKETLVEFITGGLVPLILLPSSLVSFMKYLPFYYVTYLPSMLLIGKKEEEAVMGAFILLIWLFLFVLINRFTYNKMRILYDGVGI